MVNRRRSCESLVLFSKAFREKRREIETQNLSLLRVGFKINQSITVGFVQPAPCIAVSTLLTYLPDCFRNVQYS